MKQKFYFLKKETMSIFSLSVSMYRDEYRDSRIYLYDGDGARTKIYYSASEKSINIPISEPEKSSSIGQLVVQGRYGK